MNPKTYYLSFLLLWLLSISSFAQDKKVGINDLAFMAGTWIQKIDNAYLEEIWSKPNGESMVSTFRYIQGKKAVFYEFMVIELDNGQPVLKLRHFNRGSIAWENKDNPLLFPLIELKNNTAIFQTTDKAIKLTYRLTAKSKLTVLLEEKDNNGKPKIETFNFTSQ